MQRTGSATGRPCLLSASSVSTLRAGIGAESLRATYDSRRLTAAQPAEPPTPLWTLVCSLRSTPTRGSARRSGGPAAACTSGGFRSSGAEVGPRRTAGRRHDDEPGAHRPKPLWASSPGAAAMAPSQQAGLRTPWRHRVESPAISAGRQSAPVLCRGTTVPPTEASAATASLPQTATRLAARGTDTLSPYRAAGMVSIPPPRRAPRLRPASAPVSRTRATA